MVSGDPQDPTPVNPEPEAEAKPKEPPPPYVLEAARIAKLLGEEQYKPRRQIRKLGQILGIEGIQKLYERTLEVEAAGGMFLELEGRRRSPGGVFFVLSHDQLSDEQFLSVFQRPRLPPGARPPLPRRPSPKNASPNASPRPQGDVTPFPQLSPQERAAMTVPGKLELTLKIDRLPAEVHTDKNGWKTFIILCDTKEIDVKMRPKMFNKLSDAAAKWPSWVASVVGQMGPSTARGFELLEPNVQVFERKAKPASPT
jgi:hypothetical protein